MRQEVRTCHTNDTAIRLRRKLRQHARKFKKAGPKRNEKPARESTRCDCGGFRRESCGRASAGENAATASRERVSDLPGNPGTGLDPKRLDRVRDSPSWSPEWVRN